MPLKEVTFQFLYVVGYPANNAVFRTGGFERERGCRSFGRDRALEKEEGIGYFITWRGIFRFDIF